MPAYLIANLTVTDPAKYQEYRAGVAAALEAFGGQFLVRGGAVTQKEGAPFNRVVVVRFPDMATAEAFYHSPEYAGPLALRLAAAEGSLALVEGVA